MPKQVKGFLAEDGTFFEREPECWRYENLKLLESLCETHELNYENFIALINAWHQQIKGYYDADKDCQIKQTGKALTFQRDEYGGDDGRHGYEDDIPAFLPPKRDIPHAPSGDKDAPGFLEQSIGKYK